jgi:hypothetical protein
MRLMVAVAGALVLGTVPISAEKHRFIPQKF